MVKEHELGVDKFELQRVELGISTTCVQRGLKDSENPNLGLPIVFFQRLARDYMRKYAAAKFSRNMVYGPPTRGPVRFKNIGTPFVGLLL